MTEVLKPRLLGIDPGSKRIGFALSDDLGLLARPLEVWNRKSRVEDAAHVVRVALREEAKELVVGVPYRLDGSLGPAAERALAFASMLREAATPHGIVVTTRDEALTTYEAETRLKDEGLDWKARKKVIDAHAAAVILQEELDARRA